MIAIAADERPHVFFMPVGEQKVIIVAGFTSDPAIESFVHDDKAETIGDVEEFRSGGIVAGTNGVAAHFLQNFQLTLKCAGVNRRAERAEIVMVANAIDRDALIVQEKAVIGCEFDGANAK